MQMDLISMFSENLVPKLAELFGVSKTELTMIMHLIPMATEFVKTNINSSVTLLL